MADRGPPFLVTEPTEKIFKSTLWSHHWTPAQTAKTADFTVQKAMPHPSALLWATRGLLLLPVGGSPHNSNYQSSGSGKPHQFQRDSPSSFQTGTIG